MIPRQYTCDGEDISPPLAWSGVPDETGSLALVCDDPDAPMGTWVHWVLYGIPVETRELPEKDDIFERGSHDLHTHKSIFLYGSTDFVEPLYA